jgi:DNA modification methylase
MAVKSQVITEQYALYNADSCELLPDIPDNSIGLSVFSPPFGALYCYSDDEADMSNCTTIDQFFEHFDFVIQQLYRVMMPGRIVAVHCMELPTHKNKGEEIGIWDFPGRLVTAFLNRGFIQHSPRVTIWKDPLTAAVRTRAIGMAHKQIVKDSVFCRPGMPDYIIAFRKPGENPRPVAHPHGLTEYVGSRSVPAALDKYIGFTGNQGVNKRSHWIWQQYASPVWFDVRQTYVLPYRDGREDADEKHVCPLQLDVIERCVALWSAEGDTVLTPFMGVGSEVFVAVKNGRKGVGIELKTSYYTQAVRNVAAALVKETQKDLLSMAEQQTAEDETLSEEQTCEA